jgi:hypothetical protein
MVKPTRLGAVQHAIDSWLAADDRLIKHTIAAYAAIAAHRDSMDAARAIRALKLHIVNHRHAMAAALIEAEQKTFADAT